MHLPGELAAAVIERRVLTCEVRVENILDLHHERTYGLQRVLPRRCQAPNLQEPPGLTSTHIPVDLQLFQCARVDSNHHPAYTGQGPQPCPAVSYASAGPRSSVLSGVADASDASDENDFCQRFVTDSRTRRPPRSCSAMFGRRSQSVDVRERWAVASRSRTGLSSRSEAGPLGASGQLTTPSETMSGATGRPQSEHAPIDKPNFSKSSHTGAMAVPARTPALRWQSRSVASISRPCRNSSNSAAWASVLDCSEGGVGQGSDQTVTRPPQGSALRHLQHDARDLPVHPRCR